MFFFAWTPTALLLWYVMRRASNREVAHAGMLQELGVVQGTGCDHTEIDTGIAVNKQAKTLTLRADGHTKTYAVDNVRPWE